MNENIHASINIELFNTGGDMVSTAKIRGSFEGISFALATVMEKDERFALMCESALEFYRIEKESGGEIIKPKKRSEDQLTRLTDNKI